MLVESDKALNSLPVVVVVVVVVVVKPKSAKNILAVYGHNGNGKYLDSLGSRFQQILDFKVIHVGCVVLSWLAVVSC